MACFTDLPSELIHPIISVLATQGSPSKRYLHEEPSISLLLSTSHPLKNLAQTCRSLRSLCYSTIFSSLRANVEDVTGLLKFVQDHDLQGQVESLLLFSTGSQDRTPAHSSSTTPGGLSSPISEPFSTSIWHRVLAVMEVINPPALTFVLPPEVFEDILPYSLELKDAWAFNIPYQVLHLEKPHDVHSCLPEAIYVPYQKIFSLRPWSHMTFNEGSSIRAYNTYEFFHKTTPSLLVSPNLWHPLVSGHPLAFDYISSHLTSFDLIAVFQMTHMPAICGFLECLPNLRRLRTQLAPSPDNHVLDDPVALGTCQRSDLWTEFEYSYTCLIQALGGEETRLPALGELTILDYANVGLREMIGRCVNHQLSGWEHDGEGHWTRDGDVENSHKA